MVSRRPHTGWGTGLQLAVQEPLPTGLVEGFAVKTKTSAFLRPLLEHQWAGPLWLWLLCRLPALLGPVHRPHAFQAKTPLYKGQDSET